MAQTGTSEGHALDASVSSTPPDGEARKALLKLAETLEGAARDKVLELAATLITPAETLITLADEAEAAVESIKEKIKGMEATLKSQADEAKAHRAAAKKLESE
jgi:excinuclease UvrABC helicase subunit UvrB